MFNILLDAPPTEFDGYPINSDFRIGIQISQALTDAELDEQERTYVCGYLLFSQGDAPGEECFPPGDTMARALQWFLTGWITDRHDKTAKKDSAPVIDMDVDQWRIYSAFRAQYGINLNTARLHYWEFMGLLTTLDECAFTRVVDIRTKDLTVKMSPELKKAYQKQKTIYALEARETARERAERERAQRAFAAKLKKKKKEKQQESEDGGVDRNSKNQD